MKIDAQLLSIIALIVALIAFMLSFYLLHIVKKLIIVSRDFAKEVLEKFKGEL